MTVAAARPRPIQSRIALPVIGMALFLMAETMLFAGLISTSMVLRATTRQGWNVDALPKLPLWISAANMAVLLTSGWLLWGRQLKGAVALGTIFVAVQGAEWSRVLMYGIRSGASVYAGVFYTLIGTHALHVIAGLACLMWAARKSDNALAVRVCSMYWFFVVIVWPILYWLVYL